MVVYPSMNIIVMLLVETVIWTSGRRLAPKILSIHISEDIHGPSLGSAVRRTYSLNNRDVKVWRADWSPDQNFGPWSRSRSQG